MIDQDPTLRGTSEAHQRITYYEVAPGVWSNTEVDPALASQMPLSTIDQFPPHLRTISRIFRDAIIEGATFGEGATPESIAIAREKAERLHASGDLGRQAGNLRDEQVRMLLGDKAPREI